MNVAEAAAAGLSRSTVTPTARGWLLAASASSR
jgi:hypothetical protein